MIRKISTFLFVAVIVCGCKTYTSNLAFRGDEDNWPDSLTTLSDSSNYLIAPGDQLELKVYANKGEWLIDPNRNFSKEFNVGFNQSNNQPTYLIDRKGEAFLPLVGTIKLAGMDLRNAQDTLTSLYDSAYVDPYIALSVTNRRVTVYLADQATVIPLESESMTLLEVIGLAGGFPSKSKAFKIKLIRGDLKNPFIQNISLRDITTLANHDLLIQPNDVVYVEPVRRPLNEALSDTGPVLGLISSIIALAAILSTR